MFGFLPERNRQVLTSQMLEFDLKGLFIPDGSSEDDVPANIIQLCCNQFGIDPEEFYGEDVRPAVYH